MSNERLSYTVDDALSAIGMGKFQLKLIAYAGVGAVGEAMELMLLSYVGLAAQYDLKLSVTDQNLISILTYVAMLFGAFCWGILADTCGRRTAILCMSVLTSIFGLVSTFSQNNLHLLLSRILVGFGIGGAQVYTTWYMEFVPRAHRGTSMIWFFAFGAIGTFLEALLAWTLMEVVVPEDSWRWLIGGTSLPSILALLFYYRVPESPRFLCSKGRLEEAAMVLKMGAASNKKNIPKGLLVSAWKKESAGADRATEGAPSTEEVMRNQNEVTEAVVSAQIDESAEGAPSTEEGAPSTKEINEVDDKDDSTVTRDKHYHAHRINIDERSTLLDPLLGNKTNGDSESKLVPAAKINESAQAERPTPATEEAINENDDLTEEAVVSAQIHVSATEEAVVSAQRDEIEAEADPGHAPGRDIDDGSSRSTLEDPLHGNKTNGDSKGKLAIRTLVSAEWWRITVLIWLLYFANSYSYSSLISLLSSSFTESPIWQYGPEHKKKPSYYKDTLITSFAEVPGLLLAYLTLDRIGRRYTMAIMSGGGIIVILAQIYNWHDTVRMSLVFCARMLTSASFVTLQIFAEEVYPTHLRTTGVGVAAVMGWIGGMV